MEFLPSVSVKCLSEGLATTDKLSTYIDYLNFQPKSSTRTKN